MQNPVPKYYITLPNGKPCSMRSYVHAWRELMRLAPDTPINGFGHFAESAAEILRRIRGSLHERINRHLPWHGRGRKWQSDWFMDMWRASRDLNWRSPAGARLRIRWLPVDLRARFAQRLAPADD